MEIHAPSKPVESIKDYLVHLSMVTIGILIALGLEQAVEARRHHELAEQARENISNEIRDNKREIDGERATVHKNTEDLQNSLVIIRKLLVHEKLTEFQMRVAASGASLNSTSWTTASSMGALAYMGYAETKRFARAYQIQGILERLQDDQLRLVAAALAPVKFAPGGPEKLSEEQLRAMEQNLLACLAQVTVWDQVAEQLSKEYERALGAA